jgi:hypothetical protein
MDPNRKRWNDQQQELQHALARLDDPAGAIQLFLDHHGGVHSSRLCAGQAWSFEDEALEGLEEANYRMILPGEDHSIAWILWHLARIEHERAGSRRAAGLSGGGLEKENRL